MAFTLAAARKHFAIVVLSFAASACGVFEKHRSNDVGINGQPGPSTDVLNLEAATLIVSAALEATNPNDFSVDTTGKTKIHATFTFTAEDNYKLQLNGLANEFINCQVTQPTPTFTWTADGTSSSATLTKDSPVTADKGKTYTLAVDVDNSPQCTKVHVSFTVVGTSQSATLPQTPDSISDVTYQSDIIVREFGTFNGQPDRAALFIILPSRGTLDISQVRGPRTSQSFYVGSLEKVNSRNEIFKQSANPMTDAARNHLLQKYAGAAAIYVEHYETPLCDDSRQQYTMDGKLLKVAVTANFTFEALPQTNDNCRMHVSALLVSN